MWALSKRLGRAGITLIELLIAIFIMSVVFAGMFYLLMSSVKTEDYVEGRGDDLFIAQRIMSQIVDELRGSKEITTAQSGMVTFNDSRDRVISFSLASGDFTRSVDAQDTVIASNAYLQSVSFNYFSDNSVPASQLDEIRIIEVIITMQRWDEPYTLSSFVKLRNAET